MSIEFVLLNEKVPEIGGSDGCATKSMYHWSVHLDMVKMVNFMYFTAVQKNGEQNPPLWHIYAFWLEFYFV